MPRPSTYTPELADLICEQIADGKSLRSICAAEGMPGKSTVFRWLAENEAFRDQYARAREAQADALADDILDIADEKCTTVRADKNHGTKADDDDGNVEVVFDSAAVARNRLRVDARKWIADVLPSGGLTQFASRTRSADRAARAPRHRAPARTIG